MDNAAIGVLLIEGAREEQGAVEAGVERALLFFRTAFDGNASQHGVPSIAALGGQGFKAVCAQLLEVALGLLKADER